MYDPIANTTFSYVMTMNDYRNMYPDIDKPSWVKITTITMISSFKTDIDISKIRNFFTQRESVNIGIEGSQESFEWKMSSTTFYNQITLYYIDTFSKKSIKIFPNGSIQVAGCSDLFDCHRVIKQVSRILSEILEIEDVPPSSFRIVMINSNFSLNYHINLMAVARTFGNIKDVDVSFDPDRYSAVKLKFNPHPSSKRVTTSVFSTGKIIVTGAETLKEIVFAYDFINRVIFKNKENIKVSQTDATELFDNFMGYKIEDLVTFCRTQEILPWHHSQTNYKINF